MTPLQWVGPISFLGVFLFSVRKVDSSQILLYKPGGRDKWCASDDYTNAIAWIPDLSNAKYRFKFEQDTSSVAIDLDDTWVRLESYKFLTDPVYDYAWELTPILHTTDATKNRNNEFIYSSLGYQNFYRNIDINVSVLSDIQSHLFVCSGSQIFSSDCYWFIFGGWEGKTSVVRFCQEGQYATHFGKYANCRDLCAVQFNPLSMKEWRHITIRYIDGNPFFTVLQNGKEFLKCLNMPSPLDNHNYIFVHSYNTNALWKLHQYTLFLTVNEHGNKITKSFGNLIEMDDNTCVSFFAQHEYELVVTILTSWNQAVASKSFINADRKKSWNFYVFYVASLKRDWYSLKLQTNDRDVVVRNILKHANCPNGKPGYRFNKVSSRANMSCTSLKDNAKQLRPMHVDDNAVGRCQSQDEITDDCIRPVDVIPMEIAQQVSHVCDAGHCYCMPGWRGSQCEFACAIGKFGRNCSSTCGFCKEISQCNRVSGVCASGCQLNFEEDTCNQPQLPIFTGTIAYVQPNCATSCDIRLNMTYYGKVEPEYYYIEISSGNRNDISETKSIKEVSLTMNRLRKSTVYNLHVILCRGIHQCFRENLKQLSFQTSCQLLNEQQFNFTAVDNCIIMRIEHFNEQTQCDLSYYTMNLNGNQQQRVTQFDSCLGGAQHFDILFEFKLLHNNTIIFQKTIRTDEGRPYSVREISTKIHNKKNIHISWLKPTPSVGQIIYYLIEWKLIEKVGCTQDDLEKIRHNVTTQNLEYTLDNLDFYANYEIVLSAFTKKGQGQTREVFIQTEYADNVDMNNLNVHANKAGANDVQIAFTIADCKLWNGPVIIQANTSCLSQWCLMEKKKQSTTFELSTKTNQITIAGLTPFTDYQLEVFVQRNNRLLLTNALFLKSLKFTTATTSKTKLFYRFLLHTNFQGPNAIEFCDAYSKTEDTISLRWSLPHPPTGVLDRFYLIQQSSRWLSSPEYKYIDLTSACEIWPEMFCITLKVRSGSTFTFDISARNKQPQDWSSACQVKTIAVISAPESPPHVAATWNESHYLSLKWQHPNRTNGPFAKFQIRRLNPKDARAIVVDFSPDRLALFYTLQTNWSCTPDNHNMNIKITAQNANGEVSSSAFSTFTCPVFKPFFETEPEVLDMTLRNVTINLSSVLYAEQKCNLYTFISHRNDNGAECIDERFRKHVDNDKGITCALLSTHNCRTSLAKPFLTSWHGILGDVTDLEGLKLSLLIVNEFGMKLETNVYTLNSSMIISEEGRSRTGSGSLWWMILIAIVSICAIAVLLAYFVYQRTSLCNIFFTPDMQHGRSQEHVRLTDVPPTPIIVPNALVLDNYKSAKKPQPPKKPAKCPLPFSRVVQVSDLSNYLQSAIFSGEIQQQHEALPKGVQKPILCGSLPENKNKNRYKNLTAYDHSRVKLMPHPTRKSDYINANYIKSPFAQKAYIASQGPLKSTLTDFWHMIINEGVQSIIMLANVTENGKTKVEKYWPDAHRMKKTLVCDDVTITAEEVFTHSHFEIRTFSVSYSNTIRKLSQYHFTTWPDHGVPMYPQSLIPYMTQVMKIPHSDEHPILVHCSAGVGRTGTIILIDVCLRLAEKTKAFDAYQQLYLLREQRPNMVDNVEQYKLAHMVILEYLTMPDTVYNCDKLELIVSQLSDKNYQEQMQYCADTLWQETAIMADRFGSVQVVKEKTRDIDIVPGSQGCLYLRPLKEGDSTYINAVYVDGFNAPKKFISTQHPLANTVDDFWRMVLDVDVTRIVSLQTEYDVRFWKAEDEFTTNSGILISHVDMMNEESCTVHTLEVTRNQQTVEVVLIEVDGWALTEKLPKDVTCLMGPWRVVDKAHGEGVTLTMCRDGASACGLFIAMCNLLERIKSEQICDVCQCVRHIRRSRKQFITGITQFKHLYRLALVYLSEFNCYANFKIQP